MRIDSDAGNPLTSHVISLQHGQQIEWNPIQMRQKLPAICSFTCYMILFLIYSAFEAMQRLTTLILLFIRSHK